jgi:MFS family permease
MTAGCEARGGGTYVLVLVTLVLFSDLLGCEMVVPVLPGHAMALGVSPEGVGLLFASYAAAQIASAAMLGWLCRRLGAALVLQLGTAGLVLSQLLYATAVSPWALFLARATQGVAGGAAWVAALVMLASAYPAGRRGWALGAAMSGMSLGALVGPPLGGLLFAWGGPRCPFYCMAAWAALLALCTWWAPRDTEAAPAEAAPAFPAEWGPFVRPLLIVALGSVFLSALEPTLPQHLAAILGATPVQVGFLFGGAALAYALASPLAGWCADRWGCRAVALAGLCACTALLPLIALPTTWAGQVVVLSLFGMACAFLLTPAMSDMAAAAERQQPPPFGLAYAAFNTAFAVGMVIGPTTAAFAADWWGFGPALLGISALSACAVPVLLLPSRRPAQAVETPAPLFEDVR